MRYALGFLKPDCTERELEETVYRIIEASGLRVVFKKRMNLNIVVAEELYREWKDEEFYAGACHHITSGPIEVFIVEGEDTIERLGKLVGDYASSTPAPNTIRGRFATSPMKNVVHSTTDEKTFEREAELLLGKEARRWLK